MSETKAKIVLQQCTSARLQVQPSSDEKEAKHVEIKRGLIIYVCFLNGATKETVEKIAKVALNTKLSEKNDGKRTSILDLPGDILIIPQATLGGSLKGRGMQYHKNIDKTEGESLFGQLVDACVSAVRQNTTCEMSVHAGTYGNRQVFSCTTNGPYTHAIDIT